MILITRTLKDVSLQQLLETLLCAGRFHCFGLCQFLQLPEAGIWRSALFVLSESYLLLMSYLRLAGVSQATSNKALPVESTVV